MLCGPFFLLVCFGVILMSLIIVSSLITFRCLCSVTDVLLLSNEVILVNTFLVLCLMRQHDLACMVTKESGVGESSASITMFSTLEEM